MASELRGQTLQPPYDGLDTDTAPDALSPTKAPHVENFLVDRPGKLPIRGPLNEASAALGLTAGQKPVGVWSFNDAVLVGSRAISAVAVRDPWVAPYRKAATADELSDGVAELRHINLVTGAVTNVPAGSVNQIPGPRHTRLGAHVYGITFDSAALPVNENGGFKKLTPLARWDGTAALPVDYANAPDGAQDIRAHYQRLFVLGGRNPDGTGLIQQNTLWFTDPIAGTTPLPDTVAAWQDNISGLTNQIVVDSDDPSDFGVGLAKVGQNLVIFKRRSIHILQGYSTSTFQIRTFTSEQGCIDPRSIVEYEDGCYFMSDQGFMWFDGTQLINTAGSLRSSLIASALAEVGDDGRDGGSCIAGRLPNGYIGISVGKSGSTAANELSITTFCGYLHAPRGAWATFSSDALDTGYPTRFGRTATKTYLMDDEFIVQANKMVAPEAATPANRGFDVIGVTTAPIPALMHSRLFNLATPLQRTQLHRFLFDYTFEVNGALDDANNGWFVTLVSGNSSVVAPEYQVPAQGSNSAYTYRRRHTKDVFAEANDVQVRVEWKGTPLALTRAELLPHTVEYQVSRLRPSE